MTDSTSEPATTSAAIDVVNRFYAAYGAGDFDGIRAAVHPDVVWRIPGRHPLSGPKHGVDEVVAFFAQLAKAGMKAEVVYLAGDDTYAVDVHRGWGAVDQASMDMLWVLFYRVANGQIVEVTNFAADQASADAFFWASYPLAPIPQRLA